MTSNIKQLEEALAALDRSEVISRGGRYVAVQYGDAEKIRKAIVNTLALPRNLKPILSDGGM